MEPFLCVFLLLRDCTGCDKSAVPQQLLQGRGGVLVTSDKEGNEGGLDHDFPSATGDFGPFSGLLSLLLHPVGA